MPLLRIPITLAAGSILGALATLAGPARAPLRNERRGPSPQRRFASWNDGPAKQAILDFVHATTDAVEPEFRPARGAHRDLRPGRHALGRASDVYPGRLLPRPGAGRGQGEAGARRTSSRSRPCSRATARRSRNCRCTTSRRSLAATLTGMTVDEFEAEAKAWIDDRQASALEAALHRAHLPADAGGAAISSAPTASRPTSSPAAARISCASIRERVYGIPPEQVVGTAGGVEIRLRQGRQAVPDQGAEAAAQRQLRRQARGHSSR